MRQEDKQVDGFELERAEERRRETELVAEDDEELLGRRDGRSAFERAPEHSATVIAAMRQILEHEHIVIEDLGLAEHELRALEALKTAVDGRDQEIHGFVYAEDRRVLLEQALAVLQPDLANLARLDGMQFEELRHEVALLREQLASLEEAQEELERHELQGVGGEAPDTEDKPESEGAAAPEDAAEAEHETSLTGPEREEEPKPPTTLGDPAEIAAAAQPWWKRA